MMSAVRTASPTYNILSVFTLHFSSSYISLESCWSVTSYIYHLLAAFILSDFARQAESSPGTEHAIV